APISLVVAVDGSLTGTVVNSAEVAAGTTGDPNLANNSTTDPTNVVGGDPTTSHTHTGDFVAGQQGPYTLPATDTGPAGSVGPITVTDTLPTGESYVSAGGTGWTCGAAAQIVTCTDAGT